MSRKAANENQSCLSVASHQGLVPTQGSTCQRERIRFTTSKYIKETGKLTFSVLAPPDGSLTPSPPSPSTGATNTCELKVNGDKTKRHIKITVCLEKSFSTWTSMRADKSQDELKTRPALDVKTSRLGHGCAQHGQRPSQGSTTSAASSQWDVTALTTEHTQ